MTGQFCQFIVNKLSIFCLVKPPEVPAKVRVRKYNPRLSICGNGNIFFRNAPPPIIPNLLFRYVMIDSLFNTLRSLFSRLKVKRRSTGEHLNSTKLIWWSCKGSNAVHIHDCMAVIYSAVKILTVSYTGLVHTVSDPDPGLQLHLHYEKFCFGFFWYYF
jgi:hypothetical protein